MMLRGFLSFLATILTVVTGHASASVIGVWLDPSTGKKIEIIDGLKAGVGPVLIYEEGDTFTVGKWKGTDIGAVIVGPYGSETEVSVVSEGMLLAADYFGTSRYSRVETSMSDDAFLLKDDKDAFLDKLTSRVWNTSVFTGQTANFIPTFTADTGVVDLVEGGEFAGMAGWAVSSDVLKIDSSLILEARVTQDYLIGLDEYDGFVVFKSVGDAPALVSTTIEEKRDEFFDKLLTGEWQQSSIYMGGTRYKFRPVVGDLSGYAFSLDENGVMKGASTWEYSPNTGAINVGYREFIGAMVVNDALVMVDANGDQDFYKRAGSADGKRHTISDVRTVPLSETALEKVTDALQMQLYRDGYLYLFEFNPDRRTGHFHKWSSEPFTITGDNLEAASLYDSGFLYQVEDFVVFSGGEVFQMNASESRLRPKSDAEVASDIKNQKQIIEKAGTKSLSIRVKTINGDTIDVPLPIEDFGQITGVSIISE